jgi:ubiquinone/menaquinone biosynthesis C-methylase UbiE
MKLTGKFSNAEAYDRNTGRFSRLLVGQFIDFVGVKDGERLLDIGCGTGSLAFTAAALMRRSEIVGIDRSASFIEYARSRASDARVRFDTGDALSLPYPDDSFDKCLSMLVIQFILDVRRAVAEMARVTRQGGAVAACVWDKNDDELHCVFWDSAAELDPEAEQLRDARGYVDGQLSTLWVESGFTNVKEAAFAISPEFESFDAFWTPLAGGQGLSSTYLDCLTAEKQLALRARVREKVLGAGADRPFKLKAKARTVRGGR